MSKNTENLYTEENTENLYTEGLFLIEVYRGPVQLIHDFYKNGTLEFL